MKLYTSPMAPNGLRVTILAEKKGIELDLVQFGPGESKGADYLAINPLGQVPALVLDDGRVLTESLVISRYLDSLSGPPFLCGESIDEIAEIGMWERRAEFRLFVPAVEYGHHVHPMFSGFLKQFPDWAETAAEQVRRFLPILEEQLSRHAFLAGDRFTIADITAYLGVRLALFYGLYSQPSETVSAWLDRIEAVAPNPYAQLDAAQSGSR